MEMILKEDELEARIEKIKQSWRPKSKVMQHATPVSRDPQLSSYKSNHKRRSIFAQETLVRQQSVDSMEVRGIQHSYSQNRVTEPTNTISRNIEERMRDKMTKTTESWAQTSLQEK